MGSLLISKVLHLHSNIFKLIPYNGSEKAPNVQLFTF